MARQIIVYPANVPCPVCGGVVQDWHTEWTDPAHGPDFYKGLRAVDCLSVEHGCSTKSRRFKPCPQGTIRKKRKDHRSRRHDGQSRNPDRETCATTWIKAFPDASTGVTLAIKK